MKHKKTGLKKAVPWTPIVGKKFTPENFNTYVKGLHFDWKPQFVVLHNTSTPNLAQYKHFAAKGVSDEHWLQNLAGYYHNEQHWSAGPHLFIVPTGICVFTPLTHPGVHSPSWNHVSWGVEMVGDYETDPFNDDMKDMATTALAILHHYGKLTPLPYERGVKGLHFHKEDPKTTHKDCPGKHVIKPEVVKIVQDKISSFTQTWWKSPGFDPNEGKE